MTAPFITFMDLDDYANLITFKEIRLNPLCNKYIVYIIPASPI